MWDWDKYPTIPVPYSYVTDSSAFGGTASRPWQPLLAMPEVTDLAFQLATAAYIIYKWRGYNCGYMVNSHKISFQITMDIKQSLAY